MLSDPFLLLSISIAILGIVLLIIDHLLDLHHATRHRLRLMEEHQLQEWHPPEE